jgi:hypothetical protein
MENWNLMERFNANAQEKVNVFGNNLHVYFKREKGDSYQTDIGRLIFSGEHVILELKLVLPLEEEISQLHVEALSEIKATIDGNSKQSIKRIIYGVIDEIYELRIKNLRLVKEK